MLLVDRPINGQINGFFFFSFCSGIRRDWRFIHHLMEEAGVRKPGFFWVDIQDSGGQGAGGGVCTGAGGATLEPPAD